MSIADDRGRRREGRPLMDGPVLIAARLQRTSTNWKIAKKRAAR